MHALAKILASHSGRTSVEHGELVRATPDYVMMHDRGIGRTAEHFREAGGKQVWDPARVIVVFDHSYPPPRVEDAQAQREARAFMKAQGITQFYPGQGIAHVLLPERGYARPGALIVGTDSHVLTAGATGCFATGLGHSDVASLLALGSITLTVPQMARIEVHGDLKPWVSAKDVMLLLCKEYGDGAFRDKGVEFGGPTVRSMSMDGRLTLANLAVEVGARSGYIQPDEVTWGWLEGRCPPDRCYPETTDSDADYASIVKVDVSDLQPLVALPHDLSRIRSAAELDGTWIDEAVLGTCSGGRLEDFRAAAAVLAGRRLARHVRMVVNPGSTEVYRSALREGLIDVLVDAGAVIGTPGCGPCGGCQLGMLAPGEVAISTSSRNFRGRMGSPESLIYVASAATVAASAATGRITDPRRVMGTKEAQPLSSAGG